MAQVYAALTYYHANREDIEQSLKRDREDYDRLYAESLLLWLTTFFSKARFSYLLTKKWLHEAQKTHRDAKHLYEFFVD